jgi:hypothetical protein
VVERVESAHVIHCGREKNVLMKTLIPVPGSTPDSTPAKSFISTAFLWRGKPFPE